MPWVQPGDAGFVRTDIRFSHEYVTPMAAIFFEQLVGPDEKVMEPESILFFRDHLTFLKDVMTPERVQLGLLDVADQLEVKQREFAEKQGMRLYGELGHGRHGSEAICHSKILESYALPGQVIIGSDSHTPHAGAVGCVAFGVGTTAIFNSWITKDVRVEVPQSFKVVVRGEKPENVTAKDFMLEILRHPYIKDGHAIGQIIEYAGAAVEALSVDERATMTNMAAEVGAFTGIVAPDAKAVEYLVAQRGMSRAEAERLMRRAALRRGRRVREGDRDRRVAAAADGRAPRRSRQRPVRRRARRAACAIDIAYAGSCTAGKKEDMDMYARVLREAHERGERKPEHVQLYIQCGSQEVYALLPGAGIRPDLRGGRRHLHRAVVRRVHQRRARASRASRRTSPSARSTATSRAAAGRGSCTSRRRTPWRLPRWRGTSRRTRWRGRGRGRGRGCEKGMLNVEC